MAGASISITEGCDFGDPVTYEIKYTDIQPDKEV
jgi:Fe2+ transport system protein FeoA